MTEFSNEIQQNEKEFRIVSLGLVTGMLTCGSLTLLSLINRIIPGWQPVYLPWLVCFAAFERLYTYRRFGKLSLFSKEWLVAVGTEWMTIALVARMVVALSHGPNLFLAEIQVWMVNFLPAILSPEFLLSLVLIILTWFMAGIFAGLLEEMGLRQAIILQEVPSLHTEQTPAHERLQSQIINLGVGLILLTALTRVDMRVLLQQSKGSLFIQLPAVAGGGASTLLYFMLGLMLLSQAQFINLHTRWSLLNIPVSTQMSRRWGLSSLAFFGILAAAASLLPTSYSLKVLSGLGNILEMTAGVLYLMMQILLSFILFILSLPARLFGFGTTNQQPGMSLPEKINLNPLPIEQAAWLEWARTLAFWGVLVIGLIFAIIQYLRQHKEILQTLRDLPIFILLLRGWKWLKSVATGLVAGVTQLTVQTVDKIRKSWEGVRTSGQAGGFLNPRRLDSRQQVIFFYMALLKRGNEHGLARKASQTPREYAARLDSALPDVKPEIDALTDEFVQARYSQQSDYSQQALQAQKLWQKIRKFLQKFKN